MAAVCFGPPEEGNMRIKTTLMAAAAVLVISPAAHAYDGLYGAIGAGLSYLGEHDIRNTKIIFKTVTRI